MLGDWGLRADSAEPAWPQDYDLDRDDELLDAEREPFECPGCFAVVSSQDALCGACAHCAHCGAIKERCAPCDCEGGA